MPGRLPSSVSQVLSTGAALRQEGRVGTARKSPQKGAGYQEQSGECQ